MATVGALITRVLTRLSAMGGLDVQTYMQPKVSELLHTRYNMLFDDRFWRDTVTTEIFNVTDATGLITEDISAKILRFGDIKTVTPVGFDRPLPEKRTNVVSSRVTQWSFEPYNVGAKRLRILPYGTGKGPAQVEITYRTRIATWVEATETVLDEDLLVLGASADYAVGEGANMEMAKLWMSQFEQRKSDLTYLEMKNEKTTGSAYAPGVYEWHEV